MSEHSLSHISFSECRFYWGLVSQSTTTPLNLALILGKHLIRSLFNSPEEVKLLYTSPTAVASS